MKIFYSYDTVTGALFDVDIDCYTKEALIENPVFFKKDAIEWLKVSTYSERPGHALMSFAKTYYENLFDGRTAVEVMDALDHIDSRQILDMITKVQVANTCGELINAFAYIALAFDNCCDGWID